MLLSNCLTAMSLFCCKFFPFRRKMVTVIFYRDAVMRNGWWKGWIVFLCCAWLCHGGGRSVSCLCVFLHDERFLVQLHDKSHLKFWKFSGFLRDNNYTETYTWFLYVQSKNPEEVGVPCCDNGRMGHVMFPSVLRALVSVLAIFFYIFFTSW